ncbi:MAG: hypothetical protein WD396_08720, partial [Pseudohongiellaceae bacterium]
TQATIGDGLIALLAYALPAFLFKDGFWLFRRTPRTWSVFLISGLLITLALEFMATEVFDRWQYSESMVVLPLLNVGLTPVLQWLILPPLYLWLSSVFLRGLMGNDLSPIH